MMPKRPLGDMRLTRRDALAGLGFAYPGIASIAAASPANAASDAFRNLRLPRLFITPTLAEGSVPLATRELQLELSLIDNNPVSGGCGARWTWDDVQERLTYKVTGWLLTLRDCTVIHDERYREGNGVFEFTPGPGETFTITLAPCMASLLKHLRST